MPARHRTPHIVVLIPGITGSVLEKNGREIWGPSASTLFRAMATGGHSIQELMLTKDSPDNEDIGDDVRATRLMPDVSVFPGLPKVDGYTKVSEKLKRALSLEPGVNYFEFPYDWRRDNRFAASRLQRLTSAWLNARRESYPDAKVILIAHSMGGLVARYYVEVLGGWRDTAKLISFGTPYRGSLNALDSLSNGSRKLLHLFGVTTVTRSFTSTYQLLPIYACYDRGDGTPVHLTESANTPGLDGPRVIAADAFHREIEVAVKNARQGGRDPKNRYSIHPVVGVEQPTFQSARLINGRIALQRFRNGGNDGSEIDEGGDGTVPRIAATPIEDGEEHAIFAATRHASLQNADAVLTHVRGVLTEPVALGNVRAAAPVTVSLDIEDVYFPDEPIVISARPSDSSEDLQMVVENGSTGITVAALPLTRRSEECRKVTLTPLPSAMYRVTVSGNPATVEPVTDVFLVT